MNNGKIAVIGDRDSALAFKAAGADVFSPLSAVETSELIRKLAKQEYAVILITEECAESVTELILEYKSRVFPVILPIPSSAGAAGLGMRGLKYNVERAIGTDIIFDREVVK